MRFNRRRRRVASATKRERSSAASRIGETLPLAVTEFRGAPLAVGRDGGMAAFGRTKEWLKRPRPARVSRASRVTQMGARFSSEAIHCNSGLLRPT